MEVIAYVRVSTEGQEDKYGLDVQRNAIQEYANKNGYVISAWYTDVMSGANADRPELSKALQFDTNAKAILVFKKDRLSRKIEDFYYFKFKFRARGMDLISVSEPNGESAMEKVYEAISIAWAEQERNVITMRTTAGRIQKASKGGYSGGGTPLGYKSVNGKLTIVEEEAQLVREIFNMSEQNVSTLKIVEMLKEKHITTRRGKEYAYSTVNYIIHNKDFYKGMYNYGGVITKGDYEPILKGEEYGN